MIFTDGARTAGTTYLEDAPTSLGEAIGNTAAAAWHDLPIRSLVGMKELNEASSGDETLGSQIERLQGGEDLSEVASKPRPVAEVPLDQARARVKEAGLEQTLKLPDQPNFKAPALDIMMDRARDRREREAAIARGPAGFIPGALTTGTSFLVGAVDPLNIASAFIPVIGELRYAKLMFDAGTSVVARAGVRAAVGGAAGAVGSVPIIGLEAMAKTQEAQDFTMADALRQLMFGTALGGGLHSVGGAGADLYRTRKGKPLYPFAPGEPFEARPAAAEPLGSPPIAPDPARPTAGPEAEFRTAGEMPKVAEAFEPSPVVRALDDLPPRAKEDAHRAAIADLVQGRPVAVGEMLEAAAKTDPRIRQSIEAWHGSPHDFDRFDMSKLGSGEGAQAYGHGLYFAENEAVAANYRDKLSRDHAVSKKALEDPELGPRLREAEREYRDAETQYSEAVYQSQFEEGKKASLSDLAKKQGDALRVLEAVEREAHDKYAAGGLYKVRIKANRGHFLDWDKPFSEQSEHVKAALRKLGVDEGKAGAEIYRASAKRHVDFDMLDAAADVGEPTAETALRKTSSEVLREAGIPGIKYLDQGSRVDPNNLRKLKLNAEIYRMEYEQELARGGDAKYQRERHEAADRELAAELAKANEDKATSNLVLFDDKHVEITHKNGEPVSRGERAEILHAKQQGGEDGATMIPGPRAARGPRARDPETWSLNEFIAHRGGLDPADPMIGDVRGSIGTSNKFVPGFGNLIRKGGMRLDKARAAAVEAGYLHDAPALEAAARGEPQGRPSESTIPHLLEAIDREMRGERVYRAGREPEGKGIDPAQHRFELEREIHGAFEDAGVDLKAVPDKTQARVLEIMQREGERDPLHAYERAVMEESHYGAEAGLNERIPDAIPGWDLPHDAGAAPGAGAAAAPGREARAGAAARDAGAGDHATPGRAGVSEADWRSLANRAAEYDEPDILAASKAADKVEQPVSTFADKRLAAAEKAAAEADTMFKDAAAYLPEDLRNRIDDELRMLAQEGKDVADVVRQGAACLAAAAGTAA